MSNREEIIRIDRNTHNHRTSANDMRTNSGIVMIRTGEKMRKFVIMLCIIAGILVITALAILIDILVKQNRSTLTESGNLTTSTTMDNLSMTTNDQMKKRFNSPIIYSLEGNARPYHLSVDDINNDKKVDIIFANQLNNSVDILINQGNGTFVYTSLSTGVGSHPQHVSVVDINHDEQLDIVVSNNGGCNFGVFINNGNGTFQSQVIYTTDDRSYPPSLAVRDVNHDTHVDVVVANRNLNAISIFLNTGNGTFFLFARYNLGANTGGHYPSIIDMNEDHHPDIILSYHSSHQIAILYNNGSGALFLQQTSSTGNQSNPQENRIGDINNDAKLDMIVANYNHDNIGIFLNRGDGTFLSMRTISTGTNSGPQTLALVDITNDNYLDIIVANYKAHNIQIYANLHDGNFMLQETYSLDAGSQPNSLVIYDINNDNKLDMIVANVGKKNICIYLSN